MPEEGVTEQGPPQRRYVFVVPDAARAAILLVRGDDGWALPAVQWDDEWVPASVAPLADVVRSALELDGIVIRHVVAGDPTVCEMELLSAPGCDHRFAAPSELSGLGVPSADVEHAAAVLEGPEDARRPAWERPGWFSRAAEWFEGLLAEIGAPATAPVRQIKGAWPSSCVLTADTAQGPMFFKAVHPKPPAESDLLPVLHAVFGAQVPEPVAVERNERWTVLRGFDGAGPGAAESRSEEALAGFASLQAEAARHLDRWLAAGCPDWRGQTLLVALSDLARRRLPPDRAVALTRAVDEAGEALAASPISASIVNMDFRLGNVAFPAGGLVFYDWTDVVVAHPFFSLARFLDFTGLPSRRDLDDDPGPRTTFRDIYFEPWVAAHGRPAVDRDFALVWRLQAAFQALRWDTDLRHAEPMSPWGQMLDHMAERELAFAEEDLVAS